MCFGIDYSNTKTLYHTRIHTKKRKGKCVNDPTFFSDRALTGDGAGGVRATIAGLTPSIGKFAGAGNGLGISV